MVCLLPVLTCLYSINASLPHGLGMGFADVISSFCSFVLFVLFVWGGVGLGFGSLLRAQVMFDVDGLALQERGLLEWYNGDDLGCALKRDVYVGGFRADGRDAGKGGIKVSCL